MLHVISSLPWTICLHANVILHSTAEVTLQYLQESPCVDKLQDCVRAVGIPEISALYEWVATSPARAYALTSIAKPEEVDGTSSWEATAFGLFAELGLRIFTSLVDFLIDCRTSVERCKKPENHFRHISILEVAFQDNMKSIVQDYTLQSGVRSSVIQTSRNLRSDLLRFVRELASLVDISQALQRAASLVDTIGQRSRLLAHQLGMHEWVRTLAVPGRGSPMFVLHDEYASWQEMLFTLIGNMVRNGLPQLAVAHAGLRPEDAQDVLLESFEQMQYLAIIDDQSRAQTDHQSYLELQERFKTYGSRASVLFAPRLAAARAIPLQALDIVLLHLVGSHESHDDVLQELESWQARVKPGGIIAGHGFSPDFSEGVQAVCSLRFANDIHVGIDGTFWWYVEPEE